jgi:hypothetical protein
MSGAMIAAGAGLGLVGAGMNYYAQKKADRERRRRDAAIKALLEGYRARTMEREAQSLGDLGSGFDQARQELGVRDSSAAEAQSLANQWGAGSTEGLEDAGLAALQLEQAKQPEVLKVFGAQQEAAAPGKTMQRIGNNRRTLEALLGLFGANDERATGRKVREIEEQPWSNSIRNLQLLGQLFGVGSQATMAYGSMSGGGGKGAELSQWDKLKAAGYV